MFSLTRPAPTDTTSALATEDRSMIVIHRIMRHAETLR
jgi:hypothetical protein